MTNKLTRKEILRGILELAEVQANEIYVEELNKILSQVEKKNSKKSGLTKTQKENEELKVVIAEVFETLEKAVTITELQAQDARLADYSNQKLSAVVNQMYKSGVLTKTSEKGKSLFAVSE